MKPSLKLTTRQQLAFTPQIQQTVRMLQLTTATLKDEIDETLKNNPLLQYKKQSFGPSYYPDQNTDWMSNLPDQYSLSLETHLLHQLHLLNLDEHSSVIGAFIVTQLDDDGFLKQSSQQLLSKCRQHDISTDLNSLSKAIQIVQSLEPIGIASNDLSDCFTKQLSQLYAQHPAQADALRICQSLESLSQDPHALANTLKLTEDEFSQALALIKQLTPFPGRQYNQPITHYIQPDIILALSQDQVTVSLNPIIDCDIELNHPTIELLKQSKSKSDQNYLKKNLNNAKWWMNALVQRNKTLLSVADYMIRYQFDFFNNGLISLRPLGQQQIANELNLHISTVSRAIKDKYLQSPAGVILLSTLLAGRISKNENFIHSNQSVKALIRDLIKNESSQTPLSDAKIVHKLKTRGIRIARRTVNKYREQLNIPASHLRRLK